MLGKKSLPVWMLADSLILTGTGGSVIALMLLAPLLRNLDVQLDRESLERRVVEARKQADEGQRLATELQQQLDQLNRDLGDLRPKYADLQRYQNEAVPWIQNAEARLAKFEQVINQEKSLRQELLNLRGDFSRVVFVIDISGSMSDKAASQLGRPNWGDDGQPWTYVRNQVNSWLKNLPVDSFRLVCFNHELHEFPSSTESWVQGEIWREKAAQYLTSCTPTGGTNTEQALLRALQWKPTAVVLFTDGAPSKPSGGQERKWELDPAQMDSIPKLLSSHDHRVPVNVIAVSNYFDKDLGGFLQRIAAVTGGGFVGL